MSAAVDAGASVDQTEIRRTLGCYQGLPGRISVMYLQEQGAVPSYASYATTAAELEQAVRDIVKADLTDEPLGIYLRGTTVADGVSGRGVSEDTVAWLAFRADLDLAKPGGPATWPDLFAAFERARLPTPTYWQHSGGGFYPTWMLAEPVTHGPDVETLAADIEGELRRAWKEAGYTSGVDSCHDAARVWRLAGSVHRKNRDAPITSTVGKFSGELLTLEQMRERVPQRELPRGWDGQRSDPRRGTAEAFAQTYRASLAACRERGRDDFRHTFFVAARNAHRMVAIGELTGEQMRDDLLGLVQTFWPGMGFNGDDRRHIHDALNNGLDRGDNAGALASPWELLSPADEFFGGVKLREGAAVERQVLDAEVVEEVDGRPLGSWTAVDLGPYLEGTVERPAPSVGAVRTDGVQFLYPGKEHSCIGEMECGKSWFALACVAAELDKGNRVLYIHFEEDDPTDTLIRLQLLGVPTSRILAGFDFVGPESPISLQAIEHHTEVPPVLVVLDGVNEAMALHGQGIREEDGAAAYRARLVKPFTRVGAAVLSLDHVVKDSEKSSKGYALGSIHKGNGLSGSLILLENEEPFGEGRRGASRVYITKDRPGKIRKHGTPTTTPRKFFLGMMAIDAQHPGGVAFDIWAPKAEQSADTAAAEAPQDELGAQILAAVGDLTNGDDGDGWARTSAITMRMKARKADVLRKLDELKNAGKVLRELQGQAHIWQLPPTGSQDQDSE